MAKQKGRKLLVLHYDQMNLTQHQGAEIRAYVDRAVRDGSALVLDKNVKVYSVDSADLVGEGIDGLVREAVEQAVRKFAAATLKKMKSAGSASAAR